MLPMQGNVAALTQSISNLLNNAVKFVEPGRQPEVRVRSERHGERVRLWIEDNGIGIAPANFEQIFGIFNKLHPVERYEGTGIGLSIVRKAMRRMGGEVGVESQLGKGSRFWLELPAPAELRPGTAP